MKERTNQYWLETKWFLKESNIEDFQARLEQYGSLGSFENIPLDSPEIRKETELLSYFPDSANIPRFIEQIKNLETGLITLTQTTRIPQGNWATEWKKYFKPFTLTDNIVIRPSWEPYKRKEDEVVITLDPGMAFGTGQHFTTSSCAELICQLKKEQKQVNSLLDVGCGSGILSIIAKRLGFGDVTGIDIEDSAIETALENLERNPEANPILFFQNKGSLHNPKLKPVDVVVANIIAETLCELHQSLIALIKPNGFLILSGIIKERTETIKECFSDLVLMQTLTSKNWYAYLYCKK